MKWKLEAIVKLSNNNLIAMDLTLNTNKYGVIVLRIIYLIQKFDL